MAAAEAEPSLPSEPVQGAFAFLAEMPESAPGNPIESGGEPTTSTKQAPAAQDRVAPRASSEIPLESEAASGLDRLAIGVAVVGGLGFAPIAPGTAGSLGAVVLFVWTFFSSGLSFGLDFANTFFVWSGALAIFVAVGVWAAARAGRCWGTQDDGRIVIDEVAGQWIGLAPVLFLFGLPELASGQFFAGHGPSGASPGEFATSGLFVGSVVTGFVLFRLFDVWKPGAIGWAERRFKGGWGVMADDLFAGIYAAAVLVVLLGAGFWLTSFSGGPT